MRSGGLKSVCVNWGGGIIGGSTIMLGIMEHNTVEPPLSGLPRCGHLLQLGSYIWNLDLSIIHNM